MLTSAPTKNTAIAVNSLPMLKQKPVAAAQSRRMGKTTPEYRLTKPLADTEKEGQHGDLQHRPRPM